MDDLFDTWFDATEEKDDRKILWRATEAADQRAEILPELCARTRSHYVTDQDIATFLDALDYPCLLYTSPSPRDKRQSRMPSSA